MPPNYGEEYTRSFARTFADVAARTRVAFMPFLLEGVAGHPDLNLADGIHPNARGHAVIAERLWRSLRPLLAEPLASPARSGRPIGLVGALGRAHRPWAFFSSLR
jgi:acyl-CoA thioesterase-1